MFHKKTHGFSIAYQAMNLPFEGKMSAKMELRWLKEDSYQGASQIFVKFCKEDISKQAAVDTHFDFEVYESALRLILKKLQQDDEPKKQGVR